MKPPPATLCLNMIVRNERAVIERCLASVKPLISHWVIVDTGSSDGTQQVIENVLHDVPGRLIERPWVNFGHNRNEALREAAGCADFLLFIDADEVLEFDAGFVWPALGAGGADGADGYTVRTRSRGVDYRRLLLVRNSGDWHYRGVVHEIVTSPNRKQIVRLEGVLNRPRQDGARSADPHRFRRDALALEAALIDEPDNPRDVLYLANSYRDAGDCEAALKHYRRRAAMDEASEEGWYAAYQAALMLVLLEKPWPEALDALLQAWARRPARAEPLYHVALHYRAHEQYLLAELYAQRAAEIPRPDDGLFVEWEVYAWRLDFECAICAYWAGRHAEAVRLNNRVLAHPDVAPEIYAQALKNRGLSLAALQRPAPRALWNVAAKALRFRVFVPFRDPGTAFDNSIASLLRQRGASFTMHFVDLGSTDGSHRQVPLDDPRATLSRGAAPTTLAEARHHCLLDTCDRDDVFVQLDGADWLAHDEVLTTLDALYRRQGCELLYGQYRHADGAHGRAMPWADPRALADAESESLSERANFPYRILSFRAGLYRRLVEHDPGLRALKDAAGRWVDPLPRDDRPLVLPLIRLAGLEAVHFNDEVLYVLNTDLD